MHKPLPKQFFVAGTDTEVGKTVVSSALSLGMEAAYWKPIQCGLNPTDSERVALWTGAKTYPERYLLEAPMSPHAAARLEEKIVRVEDFELPTQEALVVEGCGGLMVPINEQGQMVVDIVKHLELPVLLVARSTIGTLNHSLMSLMLLKKLGIEVLGVVMNGPSNASNKHAIEHFGGVSVIAEIGHQRLDKEGLRILSAQITGVGVCP